MLTFLFYTFLVFLCTIFLVLSFVAWVLCAPFDPARRVVHGLSRILVKIFFAVPPFWRQRVEGLENIDPKKCYVVVINHNSMLDIPMLYKLPLNFRWVSKREVFQIPFFGQFLLLHGDIAIQRGNGAAAMAQVKREGGEWIERGASIAIFPEGTRSKDGQIGRFKAGAFNLAMANDCQILPVVLSGTRKMISKSGRFNWRSDVALRVLPAVDCSGVASRDMAKVREMMVEALAQMECGAEVADEVVNVK